MKHDITKQQYDWLILNGYAKNCKKTQTQPGTIVDYKTSSTKPSDIMPFGYKIQLLSYAWALRQSGTKINRIRLVYVTRPTKTLPERLFVINHMITDSDWKLVEDTLHLIAESVQAIKDYPHLKHLIFKSMSIKE